MVPQHPALTGAGPPPPLDHITAYIYGPPPPLEPAGLPAPLRIPGGHLTSCCPCSPSWGQGASGNLRVFCFHNAGPGEGQSRCA
jgi:hypothetical protein